MINDPAPILENIFKFVLNVDSLEGTILERRITEVARRPNLITPRRSITNYDLYTTEQLTIMREKTLTAYLDFFGYSSALQGDSAFTTAESTQILPTNDELALKETDA